MEGEEATDMNFIFQRSDRSLSEEGEPGCGVGSGRMAELVVLDLLNYVPIHGRID